MNKIDLRKQYKEFYNPPADRVTVVTIPVLQFLMIDGKIEPGAMPGTSLAFKQAMEVLYGVTYSLKFMSKLRRENPIDYTVMGLEALWWIEDGEFDITKPDNWCWTAMILQPEHITEIMFREAQEKMKEKKPNPGIDKLRLVKFNEGLCVQTMHIGPYVTEPITLKKMEEFTAQKGYQMQDKHHEVYIGNPLRADPAKLKTILRHPIKAA
ncbi:MAG: GyrI-like domain-containing protein [Anaerolineaceae bacterium]